MKNAKSEMKNAKSEMKNVKKVAGSTAYGKVVPLYYSIREDAVYTSDGDGRYFITNLIRNNSEKEIVDTVNRFMAM